MSLLGIAVSGLVLIVIALCYLQWQDMKKFRDIDGALGAVAQSALAKFRDQVQSYTEQQISQMDKRLKDQAASLGISIESVKQSDQLAKDTQAQVNALLDTAKQTLQGYTDTLQKQADQAIAQIAADLSKADSQSQDSLVQHMTQLTDKYMTYQKQFSDLYDGQIHSLKSQVDQSLAQSVKQINDLAVQSQQQYTINAEQRDSQTKAWFDQYMTNATDKTKSFQDIADQRDTQSKTLFDQYLTKATNQTKQLQDSAVNSIKQQSDALNKQFTDQIQAYYKQQLPLLLDQMQKALQDIINQQQTQMQSVMYKYGYRRQITGISLVVGKVDGSGSGTSLPATSIKGLASAVKTVGSGQATYMCTLPAPVPFTYDVFVQIYPTKTTPVTSDNDIIAIARPISATQFLIMLENNHSSSNDNTITVALVEV